MILKICEYTFRQLYQNVIRVDDEALFDVLRQVHLDPKGLKGALFYGFVDHEQGMAFELLALEIQEKENIIYRIAPVSVRFTLLKHQMEEWSAKIVNVFEDPSLEEKIQWIQDAYMQDPTWEDLRQFRDLDVSRHSEFPDDVIVYLLNKDEKPEAVWVRLDRFQGDKLYGKILVEPHFHGVHKGDEIAFQITEMEDHKLVCVSVQG